MSDLTIALVPCYMVFDAESERPYCLKYTNSGGELAATRFTYDRKGLNTHGFYQQIVGNRSSKNVQEFDKQNRMVRKLRKYNNGNAIRMHCNWYKGWLEATLEFNFLADGRRQSGTILQNGKESGSISYQYDRQVNLVQEDWRIGNWTQSLWYVYEPVE